MKYKIVAGSIVLVLLSITLSGCTDNGSEKSFTTFVLDYKFENHAYFFGEDLKDKSRSDFVTHKMMEERLYEGWKNLYVLLDHGRGSSPDDATIINYIKVTNEITITIKSSSEFTTHVPFPIDSKGEAVACMYNITTNYGEASWDFVDTDKGPAFLIEGNGDVELYGVSEEYIEKKIILEETRADDEGTPNDPTLYSAVLTMNNIDDQTVDYDLSFDLDYTTWVWCSFP